MSKPVKVYIIYHANCYDGFGAAWAAWKVLGDGAVYIPAAYDDDPQAIMDQIPMNADPKTKVIMLDFSFKRDVLEKYWPNYEFHIIDHHKSAEAELKGVENTIFDMNRSGAVLAWHYFHGQTKPPELLSYIEDRDLWKFSLVHTRAVHAALLCEPFDFYHWDNLMMNVADLIKKGQYILAYMKCCTNMIIEKSHIGRMGDELIPIVNATCLWSEVGEAMLAKYPDAPMVASYYRNKKGKNVWQIRSRAEFDCSVIAAKYGGGGHKNAAGFVEK